MLGLRIRLSDISAQEINEQRGDNKREEKSLTSPKPAISVIEISPARRITRKSKTLAKRCLLMNKWYQIVEKAFYCYVFFFFFNLRK